MLPDWGAYIRRGLYMEGLIFGILRYLVINVFYGIGYEMIGYKKLS